MGGVGALRRLLGGLPTDLRASLFIVLHTADRVPDLLARVLDNDSSLPVVTAVEGERFVPGKVYVAPPNRHLIVGHDHVYVRRGPPENGTRPAIDPLFRSAAASCTTRVIGVLLTGLLNDGSSGLQAIKLCGGLAIVQDPSDAAYDEMPRSAIQCVAVDHILPLDAIPAKLAALTVERRPPPCEVPPRHPRRGDRRPGDRRHAALERALYGAYRAQHERSMVVRRRRSRRDAKGLERSPAGAAAASCEEGAELLRRLIAHGETPPAGKT
jgi:hypothetical protein